jgi:hypothetical protein
MRYDVKANAALFFKPDLQDEDSMKRSSKQRMTQIKNQLREAKDELLVGMHP